MTRAFGISLITIFALSTLALAGCQSSAATNCAGFRLNDLSPSGFSALVQADRAGAERVAGNDRNFRRRGC